MTETECKSTAALCVEEPTARVRSSLERDATLDLLKGELVIVMVVYHAMNFFSNATPESYAYVRFVSGSFVLLSGYIIARFYQAQFEADWRTVSWRFVVRGFKLFLLFAAMNVAINITGAGNPEKLQLALQRTFYDVYVVGRLRYASFQVLLPISYLLMMGPALLTLRNWSQFALAASFAVAVAPAFIEVDSVNFELLLMGAIGAFGGMLINSSRGSFAMKNVWAIAVSLLTSVWMMRYLRAELITYSLGTIIILKLMYDINAHVASGGRYAKAASLLGRYSLVCYIVQIVFMQALAVLMGRPRWDLGYETFLIISLTVAFLIAFAAGLDVLRKRFKFVEAAYGLVFS